MNILHIDEQTGWRGGEQQASYLIAGLAARGHRCFVAARPGSPFLRDEHGGGVAGRLKVSLRGELDVLSARKVAAFARTNDIDILHAHTGHAHAVACLARASASKPKVVVSRRVDFPPASNAISRYKYSLPDHYVAISEAIGRVLADFGIPRERISVVHSGIDPGRLAVEPRSRAELELPVDGPLVGTVGALVGHKDHRTLLAAFPKVLDTVADAHLVIAGEGELRTALEIQIRALGLGDRIHLLGYRTDVPALLKALDVFVMSSSEEGLGTSVLDAMSCGVPVAATDAGGLPEMVRNEVTGLLVSRGQPGALAKAVVRLLSEEDLRRSLTENAQTMVQDEFSVNSMVEGNLAVYEKVLNSV